MELKKWGMTRRRKVGAEVNSHIDAMMASEKAHRKDAGGREKASAMQGQKNKVVAQKQQAKSQGKERVVREAGYVLKTYAKRVA